MVKVIKATKNDPTLTKVPSEGMHLAVVYQVIDQGTRAMSAKYPPVRCIEVGLEIPGETMDFEGEEKPLAVWATIPVNSKFSPKSKFGMFVDSTLGKEFIKELFHGNAKAEIKLHEFIGKACTVLIAHKTIKRKDGVDTTIAYVDSFSPTMKGIAIPPLYNNPIVFDLDEEFTGPNQEAFNTIPEWKKDGIMKTPEYQDMLDKTMGLDNVAETPKAKATKPAQDDDDLPF